MQSTSYTKDSLRRLAVSIAYSAGWISFVKPEIVETYLETHPFVKPKIVKTHLETHPVDADFFADIMAYIGGALGVIVAIESAFRMAKAPPEEQPYLAMSIAIWPALLIIAGFVLGKVTNYLGRKLEEKYRTFTAEEEAPPTRNVFARAGMPEI